MAGLPPEFVRFRGKSGHVAVRVITDCLLGPSHPCAETMHKAAAGHYDHVLPPTLVLGKEATRANLERVIDRIAADIHPRDTFILFASGHGTSSNGRFYLIPQDYQSGSARLADGAISQDQVQHWLANRIKARRAIILLDTCQSGALVAGHRRSRIAVPASEAAVGRLHEATGRPVLTAAAAGQDAIEGVAGADGERHGVFTWAVLDALRKGDTNGDGFIELSELVAHVQSVVPKIAAAMSNEQAARFGSQRRELRRGATPAVTRRGPQARGVNEGHHFPIRPDFGEANVIKSRFLTRRLR